MSKNKLQILNVKIENKVDESPDLSFLGEYSRRATSPCAIDRVARGDAGRNEFQYFNPEMTGEETGNPESPEQDYQRMESYNRGEWHMVGIIAKAEIRNPATDCTQVIRSGGLWGVESDGGEYLNDVAKEQLSELAIELRAFAGGIGERAIAHAIKNCIASLV